MKKIIFLFLSLLITFIASAQTTASNSEILKYKEKNGLIVVELIVNGTSADFMIDLSGQNTILSEYVEKLGIKDVTPLKSSIIPDIQYLEATGYASIATLAFGNNVFANGLKAFIIPDNENKLRSLEVAGTINGSLFKNCVLTINAKRKEITTSISARPAYMKLKNRTYITMRPASSAVRFPIAIDGKTTDFVFETSEKVLVSFPNENKSIDNVKFVNTTIPQPKINTNNKKKEPIIGLDLLQYGILSIDYPRMKVYFQDYGETLITEEPKQVLATITEGKLNSIGRAEFLEYIFDYRNGTDFILKGDKPVVIDFWTSWCGPCMKMLPQMEKIAETYKDKIVFYKVNADKEKELCSRFNIQSLPTLFFIPKEGAPIVEVGALPEKYIEIIKTKLLNE